MLSSVTVCAVILEQSSVTPRPAIRTIAIKGRFLYFRGAAPRMDGANRSSQRSHG